MDRDTLPPTSADEAALAFGRRLAEEIDTGPLAMPGSVRFVQLEKHTHHDETDDLAE